MALSVPVFVGLVQAEIFPRRLIRPLQSMNIAYKTIKRYVSWPGILCNRAFLSFIPFSFTTTRGLMQSSNKVQFEELGKVRRFESAELQERADRNPWRNTRKQYRVSFEGKEAGYLSFDISWEDEFNLYEVFILEAIRNQGVGTECIRFAVNLGKELRKPRLTVQPGQISNLTLDDLVSWYKHRGFSVAPDGLEFLEIVLKD